MYINLYISIYSLFEYLGNFQVCAAQIQKGGQQKLNVNTPESRLHQVGRPQTYPITQVPAEVRRLCKSQQEKGEHAQSSPESWVISEFSNDTENLLKCAQHWPAKANVPSPSADFAMMLDVWQQNMKNPESTLSSDRRLVL